ncbi:hypothetical protein XENOCAPTIV_006481 [Xenoophorus captivus]|uniref:Uncharacterized protein n=1 Tax=Xenoophorus captivus TaxID=1517983 RepID=A0ABV0QRN3_9TELE
MGLVDKFPVLCLRGILVDPALLVMSGTLGTLDRGVLLVKKGPGECLALQDSQEDQHQEHIVLRGSQECLEIRVNEGFQEHQVFWGLKVSELHF